MAKFPEMEPLDPPTIMLRGLSGGSVPTELGDITATPSMPVSRRSKSAPKLRAPPPTLTTTRFALFRA